jgi:uncharacterized membrane protein
MNKRKNITKNLITYWKERLILIEVLITVDVLVSETIGILANLL